MNSRNVKRLCRTGAVTALMLTIASFSYAEVPEPFAFEAEKEQVSISYNDWSYILKATVFVAGPSDRRLAPRPQPAIGRRTVKGNTSALRLEGNRLFFIGFEDENVAILTKIRRELEALPDIIPMAEWTRNQQLAYWLNLYNITVVEALAQHYPTRHLRALMAELKSEKRLTVAGVPLSLDDIQHRILAENWRDPLVIYGLWQGYVGGPNILPVAFTSANVHRLLKENAAEFINSNRGASMSGDTLEVSTYYGENMDFFPGGEAQLQAHLVRYADTRFAPRFASARVIRADTSDYYIADLHEGVPYDVNPNAGNPAAITTGVRGFGDATEFAEWASELAAKQSLSTMPPHVLHYLGDIRRRNEAREGNVNVEEYEGGEKTEAPVPE